jgi:hypothetical protein
MRGRRLLSSADRQPDGGMIEEELSQSLVVDATPVAIAFDVRMCTIFPVVSDRSFK